MAVSDRGEQEEAKIVLRGLRRVVVETLPLDWGFVLAVDSAGNVLVGGGFVGTTDFGGGPLVNNTNQLNVAVAKLDSLGNHVWSKHFGGNGWSSYLAEEVDLKGKEFAVGKTPDVDDHWEVLPEACPGAGRCQLAHVQPGFEELA